MPPTSSDLTAKRSVVFRLVAAGVPTGIVLIVAGYSFLPPLRGVETTIDRLLLALRCDVVASLTLLAGIQAVASLRIRSEAIDPLAGKDLPRLQIHGRYVQNTLEQLVLFVLGITALSTFLMPTSAHLLPVLTAVFIASRLAFWIGYLRHPLLRAFGMSITLVVNYFVLGADLYYVIGLALDV